MSSHHEMFLFILFLMSFNTGTFIFRCGVKIQIVDVGCDTVVLHIAEG